MFVDADSEEDTDTDNRSLAIISPNEELNPYLPVESEMSFIICNPINHEVQPITTINQNPPKVIPSIPESPKPNSIIMIKQYKPTFDPEEILKQSEEIDEIQLPTMAYQNLPKSTSCKYFDLHASQSLLLPLNTQSKLVGTYLMQNFLIDFEIIKHLRTLMNYYFFFNTEYKFSLTTRLFKLLYRVDFPKQVFNYKVLHDIMEMALSTSTQSLHFTERISLQLVEVPLVLELQSARLLNCLSLTYQVDWPLNIIITDNILVKYNKIFQYLLKLRRVQWALNDMFNVSDIIFIS